MQAKHGWKSKGSMVVAGALLGLILMTRVCTADEGDTTSPRRALARALALVSLKPDVKVTLIDPELAADPDAIRTLDAFVVRQPDGALRPVIYLNAQSEILHRAAGGSDLYVAVLAAVIHHEAQHLNGAPERDARRAETEFFEALISRGAVSPRLGREYLQLLVRRDR
jgi:hypothetical protein